MRCLVCGQGSAGTRHARLLAAMGHEVAVVSGRPQPDRACYPALAQGLADGPWDYVVIATATNLHHAQLRTILESGHGGPVLVEKPLFHAPLDMAGDTSRVFVGYNLRFHPAFARFAELLGEASLCSLSIRTGQHLSQWRPGRDVRQGYSAQRSQGGGVLRDLSHELDYALLLAGPFQAVTALGGRFADVTQDSEDVFHLLGRAERCPAISICLDYLDEEGRRDVVAHTSTGTVCLDFMRSTVTHNGKAQSFATEPDQTYVLQHLDILENGGGLCCTYEQGMAVSELIAAAETAAEHLRWEAP